MRTNLKIFRVKKHLSQDKISEKIGCSRGSYSAIECGTRNGRETFWNDLAASFNLTYTEVNELKKID